MYRRIVGLLIALCFGLQGSVSLFTGNVAADDLQPDMPGLAQAQSSQVSPGLEGQFERRLQRQQQILIEHTDANQQVRSDLWLAGVQHTRQMRVTTTLRGGAGSVNALAAASPVSGTQWKQIGPAPLRIDAEQNYQGAGPDSGEVVDIALDPRSTTDQTVYIATNDGGIWKSTDGGASWQPKTDFMPSLSMGAVALDPGDASIVYAGTGNLFDGGGVFFKGVGIYRSTDAGNSWQIMGQNVFTNRGVNRIVLPAPGVLVVATNVGVYRSVDGGQNFGSNAPQFNNGQPIVAGFISDVDLDTANPNTIYASVRGTGILVSTDGGATFPLGSNLFTAANGGPSAGSFAFITFAQSTQAGGTANNDTLYALVQNAPNGRLARLFRSLDRGAHWVDAGGATLRSAENAGCQCGYDQTVGVDPQDPTRVYIAFQELYLSTDSGATFGTPAISRNKIHWDHHALVFSPRAHWASAAPTRFWVGTDGGVASSSNGGSTFANLNEGIATNLFNGIDIGRGTPTNRGFTYGGTQDTGTIERRPTFSGLDWHLGIDGDGNQVAVDPTDPTRAYGADDGIFVMTIDGGAKWDCCGGHGLPSVFLIAVDPNNNAIVYATSGAQLFQSTNTAASFTSIHTFPSTISSVATSQSDGATTLWVGLSNGSVQRTNNALAGTGSTWTALPITGGPGQPVSGLAVDPTNATQAVAVFPGFSGINPVNRTRHVFRTTDNGANWTDVSGTDGGDPTQNLPDLPLHSVVIDAGATPHGIIVASDAGVMRSANLGATWQVLGTGLPTVDSRSLALDASADSPLLRVGTYGRSVFELMAAPRSPTSVTITSSSNPSVFGQPVIFTASVLPSAATGTVQFTIDGNPLGGPLTLSSGQAATPAITTLSVGTHTVAVNYSGDGNFLPSSATLTQVVTRAPTTVSLTSAPSPAFFGQPVTFTAVVSPAPPSSNPPTPPTGTVTFSINGVPVANVALTPGLPTTLQSTATYTTSGLLPGSRPVTAVYSGDTNFLPGTSATLSQVVTCTTNSSDTPGSVVVDAGGSMCIVGVHVGGSVIARQGARLFISHSTVGGGVSAQAPTLFGMCDTEVTGSLAVTDATGFVLVGDPGDDGCAGNVVDGSIRLIHSQADVEIQANRVGGAVVVSATSGSGTFPDDTQAEIVNNTIRGGLSCAGNVPPPTNDGQPNSVVGAKTGQCAGL